MKEERKVLIVSSEFPPQPGGIGNHAYNLAKHLQLNKFHVEVISDNRSIDGEAEKVFDSKANFKIFRVFKKEARLTMYLKRIRLVLKQTKTNGIIIASGKFSLWVVAFCSLFYKREYVAVIHGSEVNYTSNLLKHSVDFSLKRFSKIIVVSHYTKSLIDYLNLKNISVIPNGFDLDKWRLNKVNTIDLKGKPKLMTVGNVTERKGQQNVIKQLPELLKFFPEIHYHCVGIPSDVNRLLKLAFDLGVDKYVTFHGKVDDTLLQELLVSSDVFVMLSSATQTGDVEGFGIAILEANALGIPAIGALNCGIEDAINNHKSGILIPHDDTFAFIDALKQIFDNKSTFSNQAKIWAESHHWNLIIKKYIEVLNL